MLHDITNAPGQDPCPCINVVGEARFPRVTSTVANRLKIMKVRITGRQKCTKIKYYIRDSWKRKVVLKYS